MKKKFRLSCLGFAKITVLILALVSLFESAKAQSLATWTMDKTNQYKPTLVAPNVTAGSFSADAAFGSNFSNTTGYRLKQSLSWPSVAPTTNTFNVDFPISPKGANDIILNGISILLPGTNIAAGQMLVLTPYYQIDGAGSWVPIAAGQSVVSGTASVIFSGVNQTFYSTHTYVVRIYVTTSTGATKNEYFYIWNVVLSGTTTAAAAKPTVSTLTAAKSVTTPEYAGTATGTYSTGSGFQAVTQSGVCWTTNSSVSPDASLPSITTDGSNGIINSNITGLSVATTYYVRAYAITPVDTIYGTLLSFTTDAASKPVLSTNSATNILSNKATSGGTISDNGGNPIIQEGIYWSTTSGAETATSGTNFTKDGASNTAFSSLIKPLLPSTTYFAKAYATNNLGLSYANNEISFTTGVPVPNISASPTALSFGAVVLNAPSVTLGYTLSGTNLSPAAGTITVTPPVGFSISSSTNSGFVTAPSVLTIPYTNKTLSTKVYVKQITSNYAVNADNIIISGGGAVNPNIDTVAVTGNVTQDPNVLTNLGTDFWVGHGLEEHMSNKNGYGLQLYIAAGAQPSTVKVSIPGIPSFTPQYYTVAANSVQIVSGFPTGDAAYPKNAKGLPDARLYYTGLSDRGIHVEVTNNVPVAVFLYDYATNNSAGGSMVFPTNTWNSSYIVQTYGGAGSNTGSPNTYFFVMAKDDNTVVTFKPTNPIIDSASSPVVSGNKSGGTIAYAANTTTGYQVVLNKGQVFNAVGLVDASTKKSYDLTGTIVTSDCGHPISVFAGNSRTLIDAPGLGCTPNSGSDNLIQQMFPKVAWGTQYLTVPTKTMEYNVFRIGVQDTTTVVTVDGTPLLKTTLNPTGLFYEIEGNTCRKIVSDKPITVTQFILPGGACGGASVGNNGTGDPEMILLSPIQQAIKSTTVYMSDFKDGAAGGTYINVVIPTSGVPSFRLDMALNPIQMVDTGTSSYVLDTICNCAYGFATLIPIDSAFKPFPFDSGYSWARFHVDYQTNPVHTLSADIGFNAIAYGVAKGESWGYNAGTAIKDLTILVTANTPFGKSPTATTCKGNSTSINVSLPYDPAKISSLQWVSANDPSVTPANDTTNFNGVVSTGSIVKDGVTYYTFKSPKNYTFDSLGTFKFTVTAFGTFTNECGGFKAFDVIMNVIQDTADFSLAAQSWAHIYELGTKPIFAANFH